MAMTAPVAVTAAVAMTAATVAVAAAVAMAAPVAVAAAVAMTAATVHGSSSGDDTHKDIHWAGGGFLLVIVMFCVITN